MRAGPLSRSLWRGDRKASTRPPFVLPLRNLHVCNCLPYSPPFVSGLDLALMDTLQAVALGILQGLTEFLPISSSAHLILVPQLTGWPDQGLAFDLAVHVGTLLAVVIYFRRDLVELIGDGVRSVIQRRTVGKSRLAWAVAFGTIPTALAGMLLMDAADTTLRAPEVFCITTLVFGLLLGFADWTAKQTRSLDDIGWKDVLLIGLAQALALVPGTSRSGSTITAGLLLGLTREAASRFSFLLAIPITALASGAKLTEVAQSSVTVDWTPFVIGAISAFITAIIAIHYFLKWLNRFGMMPYVIYRIGLAIAIYWLLLR